jgi:arginyl-tRNA--protein-N-Asp/Glu arginylyltransferase
MAYKARFQPSEILVGGVWRRSGSHAAMASKAEISVI